MHREDLAPDQKLGISGRIAAAFQASQITPLLALIALLLGLFAMLVTPREEEPQINVTMANVLVPFPGASAEDVENLVARPAEQVLSRIAGIEHVYSVSRPGMAVITVQFEVGLKISIAGAGAPLRHHQVAQGLAVAQSRRHGTDRQAEGHRRRAHLSLHLLDQRSEPLGVRVAAGGARRRDRTEADPRHA